jgi:hypothetical protein
LRCRFVDERIPASCELQAPHSPGCATEQTRGPVIVSQSACSERSLSPAPCSCLRARLRTDSRRDWLSTWSLLLTLLVIPTRVSALTLNRVSAQTPTLDGTNDPAHHLRELSPIQTTGACSANAILSFDGLAMQRVNGNLETFNGVFGVGSELWTVGDAGGTFRSQGGAWNHVVSGVTDPLWSLWGSSVSDVWAVGPSGVVIHWDGTAWSPKSLGLMSPRSISGSGPSSIWTVGGGGGIYRYDGVSWTKEVSGTTADLYGVWALDASNVWAVGSNGTIVRRSAGKWQSETSPSNLGLLGVWAADSVNVFAVGEQGTILRRGSSGWVAEPSSTTSQLWSVMGSSATSVWAVGTGGQLLQRSGTTWRSFASGTTNDLFQVLVTGRRVLAVGAGGAVLLKSQ